jgi:BMFP domain-containing protein YqiC
MDQGLAVLLSSADKRMDKSLAEIRSQTGDGDSTPSVGLNALEERVKLLEASFQNRQSRREDVSKEVILAVAEVREGLQHLEHRLGRLEQRAVQAQSPPVRRLVNKD